MIMQEQEDVTFRECAIIKPPHLLYQYQALV